jgi:hypothetical protein
MDRIDCKNVRKSRLIQFESLVNPVNPVHFPFSGWSGSEVNSMIDPHMRYVRPVTPSADGCEDCLRTGSFWVHLRLCLTCGHVGCCDSSPNRHARKHFHFSGHPIVQSYEPGENWRWCYADEAYV